MLGVTPSNTINEYVIYNLISSLRGESSQRSISVEMGYSFNQISKWESGTKKITVEEFFDYCEYLNIDLIKIFLEVYSIDYVKTPHILLSRFIDAFYYRSRLDVLQFALDLSSASWNSLLTGNRKVFLIDFFTILNIVSGRLEILLEKLSNRNSTYKYHLKSICLIKEHPEVLMVSTAIQLSDYINSNIGNGINLLVG